MTDYAKFNVRALYSENSDYSDASPDTGQISTALTPSESQHFRRACSTTAATEDLSGFTSITGMLARNTSTTAAEVIWVTLHTVLNTTGALVNVVCADANPDTIALAGQTWVTTYSVAAGQYVRISAASNTGTHLIDVAAEAQLTLGTGEALAAATENATLFFQNKNVIPIAAGGTAVVVGAIAPSNDLVYRSASGTPTLEVFFTGA